MVKTCLAVVALLGLVGAASAFIGAFSGATLQRQAGLDIAATPAGSTRSTGTASLLAAKKGGGGGDAASVVQSAIKDNKVVVFSWTSCPFCRKAKSVLADVMQPGAYSVIELDERADGEKIRGELNRITGRTSVPQIWIGGTFIGGCNDGPVGGVAKLQEAGKLVPLLQKAGAAVK